MKPALLLNATYEPIEIINWQRCVKLVYKQKASAIEKYDEKVRSADNSWELPSVIRLKSRVKTKKKEVSFTRSNVYRRDGFQCQYCGERFNYHELTFDHVVPKSHGGETSWENITTACEPCNHTKGDRTPEEAGMELLSSPKKPGLMPFNLSKYDSHFYSEDWDMYLWS